VHALARNVRQLRAAALPVSDTEPLALAPPLSISLSPLALQFVNDLPGVLAQIRRALKPDGLFLAAMIGGETLTELRQSFAAAEAELRAAFRRASRRSPTCAILAACCSGRASRCR
jgi:SAM-dependent methyltransferase